MNRSFNTLLFLLSELVVLWAVTNTLYMDFSSLYHHSDECSANCQQQRLGNSSREGQISAKSLHEMWFKVVFQLGMAAGGVLAGFIAYRRGEPVGAIKALTAIIAVTCLLLSNHGAKFRSEVSNFPDK